MTNICFAWKLLHEMLKFEVFQRQPSRFHKCSVLLSTEWHRLQVENVYLMWKLCTPFQLSSAFFFALLELCTLPPLWEIQGNYRIFQVSWNKAHWLFLKLLEKICLKKKKPTQKTKKKRFSNKKKCCCNWIKLYSIKFCLHCCFVCLSGGKNEFPISVLAVVRVFNFEITLIMKCLKCIKVKCIMTPNIYEKSVAYWFDLVNHRRLISLGYVTFQALNMAEGVLLFVV